MKTINVSDNIHEQLLKVQGELQRLSAKRLNFEDTIKALLDKWKK